MLCPLRTADATARNSCKASLPRNHVVGCAAGFLSPLYRYPRPTSLILSKRPAITPMATDWSAPQCWQYRDWHVDYYNCHRSRHCTAFPTDRRYWPSVVPIPDRGCQPVILHIGRGDKNDLPRINRIACVSTVLLFSTQSYKTDLHSSRSSSWSVDSVRCRQSRSGYFPYSV